MPKNAAKKRIGHPIGRSVTNSPVRILYVVLSNMREKERTHKKQFHEWKVFGGGTHAIKSFPSSAQPPPKKERCVMLSACDFPKKQCLLKKRRKPKLFIRASDRRLPKKVCPVVGCFLWFFFAALDLYLEVFILCGTWINHKIWFRCQFLDQEVCMTE